MIKYLHKYLFKRTSIIIFGGIMLNLSISSNFEAIDGMTSTKVTNTYKTNNENFPNPERGFATAYEPPWPEKVTWGLCEATDDNYNYTKMNGPLKLASLKADRANNISLALVRYHIAKYRHQPLSSDFLELLKTDFRTARQAGVKLVIRFSYNWPMGGHDAPVDQVLMHLDQLKPVIQDNVDVIAFMEAGFIGCWGEWHHTTNQLINDEEGYSINQNSRKIIDKIFEILPPERMVAVRYPRHKFQYFGSENWKPISPLTESEAFNSTKKARWAHHDDCLVCGEWNYGTYWSPRKNGPEVRDFLSQDNRFLVQSGEPGDPGQLQEAQDEDQDGYTLGEHDSCSRIVGLLSELHWSVLNVNYNPQAPLAYERWNKEGCYNEIAKKLGYRFRLQESFLPKYQKADGKFLMSFKIVNDGWATPYNPRKLEVILRNQVNGQIFTIPLQDDPRFWQSGKVHIVNVNSEMPVNILPGKYEILLNLPDPTSSLKNRPEYSIRLANENVWEENTGYNSLLTTVVIE